MYQKFVLDNGIRVLCEKMESIRSVAVGVWVGAGSRFESNAENGVSHFIEHMLFKGTAKRTAKQIAEEMDAIGGQMNAFTAKDCTCYYAKTLDEHIDTSLDILSDLLLHSKLLQTDINLERNVILEEINMCEDAPEDLVHDYFSEIVWKASPLGKPILGTRDTLSAINQETMRNYMKHRYIPQNIVISIAGSFNVADIRKKLEKKFGRAKSSPDGEASVSDTPKYFAKAAFKAKKTEQVHLCVGTNGIEIGNDDTFALQLANYIFGGGMSSILFQKIREELGLVYSIYAYLTAYKNAGLYTIYAGMNPDQAERVLTMVLDEMKQFRDSGMTAELLGKAKEQYKGNYVMGLENSSSRMMVLGKSELLLGYVRTPDEVIEKIEQVTLEKVYDVVRTVFDMDRLALATVGKLRKDCDKTLKELVSRSR